MSALRIRYVDGSRVVPRCTQVVIVEGEDEVVIQLDLASCPTLLMDALSETLTEWAHERFIFGGPGEAPRRYVYELASLPGEWARVVLTDGLCRILVDPTGPGDAVLEALSEKVTAAVQRSWIWVGDLDVLPAA